MSWDWSKGQTKISNQNFRLKTSLTLVSDETKIFVRYERKLRLKNLFELRLLSVFFYFFYFFIFFAKGKENSVLDFSRGYKLTA
jgi:hypothetical protein